MTLPTDYDPDQLFRRVWRTSLDEPGFALVRLPGRSSHDLRRFLFSLADSFSDRAAGRGWPRFVPERLGRFDQQVTSRFHRDGAPAASLLLLGYEPTSVRSRLFVADPHRAAAASGTTAAALLASHNPMFPTGEQFFRPYVTEVPIPLGEAFVVLSNNSELPFDPGGRNPLGLLHKAEIVRPDPTARRVINSVGLMQEGDPSRPAKTVEEVEHFLRRDDLD